MSFALTFDDGPGPSMPALLDVLRDARIHATFFTLGCNVLSPAWGTAHDARAMMLRAIAEGHELANHSMTHPHSVDTTTAGYADEVRRADELIVSLRREAGAPDSRILARLPYGEEPPDDVRAAALRAAGREPVHWTGDLYEDWVPQDPARLCDALVAHVADCIGRGVTAVLTLHISGESPAIGFARPWTVDAVRLFAAEAHARGWHDVPCPAAA
ncbi:MAG TPA: polysaccharide deacetylase family protein [Kofleriaceae bacterium]|jgi:peptidoglycan/xylan/chitin deacetylase (PgdA/CDA1 family)|nr:polysaccharide deacetylase family protein [Kofleriaceae bacterium]